MAQYIDISALIAEIEKKKKSLPWGSCASQISMECNCKNEAYNDIISLVNSMEVKEVDLEKEIELWMESNVDDSGVFNTLEFAKHIFELGLKAKQTSEEIKIGETQIYLNDDGGEPPYDGKQWLDLSCTEYEIPEDKFKDGDEVELIIRKKQK